jgi:hypothetical protein
MQEGGITKLAGLAKEKGKINACWGVVKEIDNLHFVR